MKALSHSLRQPLHLKCRRPLKPLRSLRSRPAHHYHWNIQCASVDPEVEDEQEMVEDTVEEIDYNELKAINLLDPQPGMLQQTLWRSFVIGGIGFHSGVVSYVRVRPAFAGDGRYFVRVPEGTNKHLFSNIDDQQTRIYPPEAVELDGDAEAYRSELFLKYLEYKERVGYVRDFRQFLIEYAELKGKIIEEEERLINREDPTPKSPSDRSIPATLKYLADEEHLYETTLTNGSGDRVESVEHLLAALEACGVDNARIEIEGGPEVPVVDGSALGWTIEIERMGVTLAECQGQEGFYIRGARQPNDIVKVQQDDAFVMLIPGDTTRLTYGIDHTNECPRIGSQWFSWCLQDDQYFKLHLAAAKTYVANIDDLIRMRDDGYAKAGSEQVVVIGDGVEWYDSSVLAYTLDEPVRHKVLDLIGDLSLLAEEGMAGLPFGHIIAFKANHELHLAFARKLKRQYDQQYRPYMQIPDKDQEDEDDGPVFNMGPLFEDDAFREQTSSGRYQDPYETTDDDDEEDEYDEDDEEEEEEDEEDEQ